MLTCRRRKRKEEDEELLLLLVVVVVVVKEYMKIQEKNGHQKTYWSITRVSAGLHTTTNTLRVAEQDITKLYK